MATTTQVKLIIDAQDRASAKLRTVDKNINKAGKSLTSFKKSAATAAKAMGLLGVAVAAVAIKNAVQFEKSMSNVSTLIDTSTENMKEMTRQVQEIAKRTPVPLEDLASALYDVRSAGIEAGDAMGVLEQSARLGIAGLGSTQEATNLLTSAMNVYGDESHNSTKLADILFKTVKAGKTTIAELAQGFGKTAAIAKETGISIEDLQGAVAILTTGGITASEAYTSLKAGISNILKPTADAEDAASKLGIQFDLGALQSKGLVGMLKEVAEKAGDDKQALADLFGSVEAANAIFALASEDGGAKLDQVLKDLNDDTIALDEATRKQIETTWGQYTVLKNQLNVVLIDLANVILPVLIDAMKTLQDFNADTMFGKWADKAWRAWVAIKNVAKVVYTVINPIGALSNKLIGAKNSFDAMSKAIKFASYSLRNVKDRWNEVKKIMKNPIKGFINIFKKEKKGDGRQFGGSVGAGQAYLVGEHRPEVFVPSQSGNIKQVDQAGKGEVNINFNNVSITNEADENRLVQKISELFSQQNSLGRFGIK